MSINPVDNRQSFDPPEVKSQTQGSGARFAEALSEAATREGGKVPPAVAAEILKVQMLGSALAIGAEPGEGGATLPTATQRVLERFLANLAKGEGGAAALAADGEGEAPAVGSADDAAPSAGGGGEALGADDIVEKAARRYGVDRSLIRAVIKAESNFNPRAVSSAGAQGLMQLMPSTARMLGVKDPFDPEQNVMAGTRFLKDLLHRYGGDVDSALAAYNWGPGNLEKSSGGLPRETREYLKKVKGYCAQYSA